MNNKKMSNEDVLSMIKLLDLPKDNIEIFDISCILINQQEMAPMWEWFRDIWGGKLTTQNEYTLPPWNLSNLMDGDEKHCAHTMIVIALAKKILDTTKGQWKTMTDQQRELLLQNILGLYL